VLESLAEERFLRNPAHADPWSARGGAGP